ncbi:MAG: ATP-binding protein, partial [Bacteroidetes bacterium]|nr:ATP-binding protein [Bacteroidota bacterium]
FWQTYWFLSLLAFLVIGLLYWLDRFRMQRVRATESIRARIATSLTEDLGSSLSSINLTSELARTKVETDKERTREYIDQISDTSHRMIDSMYDMIWSINPENDSMRRTVERMESYAKEMQSVYGIDVVFDVDKAVYRPEAGMDNRYGLLVVFKEAVLNACRHSKAKHIYINLTYRNQRLLISVQDDGKGFDVEAVKLGRGISEMQRRASFMGAQLTIHSEINTGTIVRLEKQL